MFFSSEAWSKFQLFLQFDLAVLTYVCGCESQVTAVFSSCAAHGCQWIGGGVISAGVQFPVEIHVHTHVSSWPLQACPFFPRMLSCLFEHSLACRVLHEKYAGGHFLSISGDGYGAICLRGCARVCKSGTITVWPCATACVLLGSLDVHCVFSLKPLACIT